MEPELEAAISDAIAQATGRGGRIVDDRSVGGGCISDARIVELDDGRRLFVKTNDPALAEMFAREAEGLSALSAAGAIRVPTPIATGGGGRTPAFIVLEAIEIGRPSRGFFERFGRELAELHRRTPSARFGFEHDNWIGSTPQPNGWSDDWVEFWRERRLGYQLRLAKKRGRATPELERLCDRLLSRLDEWIGEPKEPGCLLHGDLWSGNYLVDENGAPVLIDPACYYGRREAELAMTRLFGGFSAEFYRAYDEAWPLASGSEERLSIYELYHVLNHLNLFGSSYLASAISILERFA